MEKQTTKEEMLEKKITKWIWIGIFGLFALNVIVKAQNQPDLIVVYREVRR